MANDDVFKDIAIDEDEHEQSLQDTIDASKGNLIPIGVVSLEKLYDLQNRFQGPKNAETHNSTLMHEQINLGTDKEPKFVNVGMCCTTEEGEAFVHLLR